MLKLKNHHFKYLSIYNLYGKTMSQKLPIDAFKWVRTKSIFNEEFTKTLN